jgi:hypothetical protein
MRNPKTKRKKEFMHTLDGQLSFDALLATATRDNEAREQEKLFGHLPGSIEKAVPYILSLIRKHHAAMLAGDDTQALALRTEAQHVALKLNGFEPGILDNDDAPGFLLERLTAAKLGAVPLWGQSGKFEIKCLKMRVGVEMESVFGIAAIHQSWLGFTAHALDLDQPFLSETGYRSFIAPLGALEPGYTPDTFAAEVAGMYVRRDIKGKLRLIDRLYRP